jgi:probable rRNA maturation factor
MRRVETLARHALPVCAEYSADGLFALRTLEEVVVTVVSDRKIDRIHREFMNVPGATDVITFEHGEIVVSAETARRCAEEFGHSLEEELALYVIHGFLHLNGYLDGTESEREEMHAVQGKIWSAALGALR